MPETVGQQYHSGMVKTWVAQPGQQMGGIVKLGTRSRTWPLPPRLTIKPKSHPHDHPRSHHSDSHCLDRSLGIGLLTLGRQGILAGLVACKRQAKQGRILYHSAKTSGQWTPGNSSQFSSGPTHQLWLSNHIPSDHA
jgi:hypothetical protein